MLREATLRTPRGRVLRFGESADAAAIARLERASAQAPYIMAWTEARHRQALSDAGHRYLIYEDGRGLRAYAILGGLRLAHRAIEIVRVVVDGKGFGIGGDLLDALVRYAFGALGAHRVWTDCFDDNVPVRRTCAHYGFREEGVLREAAFYDGRYRSVVILGLLSSEAPLENTAGCVIGVVPGERPGGGVACR